MTDETPQEDDSPITPEDAVAEFSDEELKTIFDMFVEQRKNLSEDLEKTVEISTLGLQTLHLFASFGYLIETLRRRQKKEFEEHESHWNSFEEWSGEKEEQIEHVLDVGESVEVGHILVKFPVLKTVETVSDDGGVGNVSLMNFGDGTLLEVNIPDDSDRWLTGFQAEGIQESGNIWIGSEEEWERLYLNPSTGRPFWEERVEL